MAEKRIPGQKYVSIVDCKSAGCGLWTTGQTEGCAAFVGRCPDRVKEIVPAQLNPRGTTGIPQHIYMNIKTIIYRYKN